MKKYYPKAWWMVEYYKDDTFIEFEATKIEALDEEVPEKSKLEEVPSLTGHIKWDGCCNLDWNEHICGLYHVEQLKDVMEEIYHHAREVFKESESWGR